MSRRKRTSLVLGVILILLGAWFLTAQFVPALKEWSSFTFQWPMIIIGVGAFLLVLGLLTGTPDLAVPACIVGGIGGLLYYQDATGDWESWAYVWTLIPGFVGVGIVLSGLLGRRTRQTVSAGGWLILISLVLFVVFASFLGERGVIGPYWPVLLIALGLFILVRSFWRSG